MPRIQVLYVLITVYFIIKQNTFIIITWDKNSIITCTI